MDKPTIGAKIRAARDYLSLSQSQASMLTGLPIRTLSALETGARRPSWETLSLLAQVYGVSLAYFDEAMPPLPPTATKAERRADPRED